MWVAHHVELGLVVETCRFHNERVALPMPGRVAVERRSADLFRELAPIGVDLPVEVARFINNHRQPGSLYDLDRLGKEAPEWKPEYEPRRARVT